MHDRLSKAEDPCSLRANERSDEKSTRTTSKRHRSVGGSSLFVEPFGIPCRRWGAAAAAAGGRAPLPSLKSDEEQLPSSAAAFRKLLGGFFREQTRVQNCCGLQERRDCKK